MTTTLLGVGDVVVLTRRVKRAGFPVEEYRVAVVSETGDGWANYVPYYGRRFNPQNHPHAGSGRLTYDRVAASPFGLIAYTVVGHDKTDAVSTWTPRPGDAGYDVNHDARHRAG